MCHICSVMAVTRAMQEKAVTKASSGDAIRAKMQADEEALQAQMTQDLGAKQPLSPLEYERRIGGLQRECERLAQHAHHIEEISEGRRVMAVKYQQEAEELREGHRALNHQLNRQEKELHEARLTAASAMNFAIILAKSIK